MSPDLPDCLAYPYDLADALAEFLLRHPGAAWTARAEVVGGTVVARAGAESAVWRVHPSELAEAQAIVERVFSECRDLTPRPN